jgi:NTP pyrophosphatase (non-canonical NTP hydrolase)
MTNFTQIRQWAADRNLIYGSNPKAQMLKLIEEMGELAAAIARDQHDNKVDAIGDMCVVLTIIAAQIDERIEDCIGLAWEEIKDRKGVLLDGVFIKEEA